jgi:sugar O-acyltransferase (sialic acid O-acetyltransferase NeuD family)
VPTRWQTVEPGRDRVVIWGAADQGRVNHPILRELGCTVIAFVDDTPEMESPEPSIPILRGWTGLEPWLASQTVSGLGFVLAIGNPYGHVRIRLHKELVARGLTSVSFADPSALICASTILGEGLQVMAMAIVHNDVRIGRQCLINTRALIEHDCVLKDGVEIGPGATLCGRVHVGENSWIGAGAVIRPRVRIGRNAIIGVGAAVVSDVPDGAVMVGVPARPAPGKTTASAKAEMN